MLNLWKAKTLVQRIFSLFTVIRNSLKECLRWQKSVISNRGKIRVYYGYSDDLLEEYSRSGGLAKYHDLKFNFPNQTRSPNILYLISSALPVHSHAMCRFAKNAGAKIVLNQNGVAYKAWYGKGYDKINRSLSRVYKLADYVFYQSYFCRKSAEHFLGTRMGKAEILYNAVNTKKFIPAEKRKNLSTPVLLIAGSHQFFYRIDIAFKTLKLILRYVPKTRMIIAGKWLWERDQKSAFKQMRELAYKLGISHALEFFGAYNQDQLVYLLQKSDILMHTQINDACPRLVLEAMSCGVPVVYSATGGTCELAGKEGGIGISGKTDWENLDMPAPETFAEATLEVLERITEFSKSARNRAVSKFDINPWLTRHAFVFQNLFE